MRQTWSTLMITWLTVFQGQSFLLPADSDAGKYAKPYRAHKLALPKTYITKRGETVCVCVCACGVRVCPVPTQPGGDGNDVIHETYTNLIPRFPAVWNCKWQKGGLGQRTSLANPLSSLPSFLIHCCSSLTAPLPPPPPPPPPPPLPSLPPPPPPPLSTLQDKWFCSPHQTTWWLVAPVRYTSGRSPANRLPENWEPLIT